ncbi:unnamed protein product [Protopolystoma xenopodis]|uniref:Uncharacterized protein n=1 Tax=Protopolystoma xenopodis TaxID=117903 RepID=A0A448XKY2_9PLAT|nr:unnamed protein product [Protopolystoma xenopodis]
MWILTRLIWPLALRNLRILHVLLCCLANASADSPDMAHALIVGPQSGSASALTTPASGKAPSLTAKAFTAGSGGTVTTGNSSSVTSVGSCSGTIGTRLGHSNGISHGRTDSKEIGFASIHKITDLTSELYHGNM